MMMIYKIYITYTLIIIIYDDMVTAFLCEVQMCPVLFLHRVWVCTSENSLSIAYTIVWSAKVLCLLLQHRVFWFGSTFSTFFFLHLLPTRLKTELALNITHFCCNYQSNQIEKENKYTIHCTVVQLVNSLHYII